MNQNLYHIVAFDKYGGQAIYRYGEKWFRVAADEQWIPTELFNRRDALRCTIQSAYVSCPKTFDDLVSLVDWADSESIQSLDIPEIPLAEVIHRFPKTFQKTWHIGEQLRQFKNESSESKRRLRRRYARRRKIPESHVPIESLSIAFASIPIPEIPKRTDPSIWLVARRAAEDAAEDFNLSEADAEDDISEATLRLVGRIQNTPASIEYPRIQILARYAFSDSLRPRLRAASSIGFLEEVSQEESAILLQQLPTPYEDDIFKKDAREFLEKQIDSLPESDQVLLNQLFRSADESSSLNRREAKFASENGMTVPQVREDALRVTTTLRERLSKAELELSDFAW